MVQRDIKSYPFKTKNKNNKLHILVDVRGEEKLLVPEEISAMVLTKMKVRMDKLGLKWCICLCML